MELVGLNSIGTISEVNIDSMGYYIYRARNPGGYEWSHLYNQDLKPYTEESEKSQPEVGTKHDSGKPRYSLVIQEFIDDLIEVLEFGAKNHGDFNWKNVDKVRFQDAMYRHFSKYTKGELYDEDTGKQHMVHIACNAMFLHYLNRGEIDDR